MADGCVVTHATNSLKQSQIQAIYENRVFFVDWAAVVFVGVVRHGESAAFDVKNIYKKTKYETKFRRLFSSVSFIDDDD